MRPVPRVAVDFVMRQEACRLTAYRDLGGRWTIGYGHTAGALEQGTRVTRTQAATWLTEDLEIAAHRLATVVSEPVLQKLSDNQYAALLSFVFNLGCDRRWTIWRVLNAGRLDQVPAQMGRFVNLGGRRVEGLVSRRAAEVGLWSEPEAGAASDQPSSAVTRAESTPPTPTPGATSQLLAAGLSVCAAVPVAVQKIHDAAAPFAEASPVVSQGLTMLATLAACAAVAGLGLAWVQTRRARR